MSLYRLEINPKAAREIKRLDATVLERLIPAISSLSREPRPAGCKKLVDSDFWRVRVGDFRVIYRIDDSALLVEVRAVRHRSQAYSR